MLPDKIEHCIVFMNNWDVSGVFWSFSKCNIKIPHLPADPSMCANVNARAQNLHIWHCTMDHGNAIVIVSSFVCRVCVHDSLRCVTPHDAV